MDRASDKVIRKQLERERKFLTRAKTLNISPAILKESELRIKRYERLLDDAD